VQGRQRSHGTAGHGLVQAREEQILDLLTYGPGIPISWEFCLHDQDRYPEPKRNKDEDRHPGLLRLPKKEETVVPLGTSNTTF